MVEEKRDAGYTINQCYSNRREHWEKKQVEDEIGFVVRTKISASRDENMISVYISCSYRYM